MEKFKITYKKLNVPASPGKHAEPPESTTVLNQELSLVISASWQWSIQSATAWCKPIVRLCQEEQKAVDHPFGEITSIHKQYYILRETNTTGLRTYTPAICGLNKISPV